MSRSSWVESANGEGTDFPLENVPFGMFRADNRDARPGVAIGDAILDLVAASEEGLLSDLKATMVGECARDESLNALLAAGRPAISALRLRAMELLSANHTHGARAQRLASSVLVRMSDAALLVPARVGNYTDFYASIHHATNVGSMFRPDNPLLPNYKWVPIGYHGRASSIVATGTAVRRPAGQVNDDPSSAPTFGPTRRLDYEMEVGAFIAGDNALGDPVPLDAAESRIGGLCLVNDWSARDVQSWEYQPLGPFLAKNFATTVSPWMVTLDALESFRVPSYARPATDPQPLPYLAGATNEQSGGISINLEVLLQSASMRDRGDAPMRVSLGNLSSMYWTMAQLITHHASNGCNLQPGDLIASGTVSGETRESRGCLLERTWRGTEPLALPSGETRRFLEDGDEVIMRAWCEGQGSVRIGFGECRGTVTAAR